MDVKAFPALIVGVVVALVLAGAVLPVFAETTSAETTFKNEGYYNLDVVVADPEDTITIVFDHTKTRSISVNGVDVAMPDQTVTLVGSNATMVRYFYNNDNRVSVHMYISDGTGVYADSWLNQDMTITISNGVITGTRDTITKTATPTSDIYCITSETGDYVMKPYTESVKLLGDSKFIAVGRTGVNNSNVCLYAEGSINGGVPDIDIFYSADTTTTSNVEIHSTPITGYDGLYTFDNFTFDLTQGSDTVTATYSAIIVPYEVTAEKSVHPDGALSAMLNLLPLLAIAGLVTGAVVWFINRKG